MDSEEYYNKLEVMVNKAKELKIWIDEEEDYEAKTYVRKALELLYIKMRELIKERDLSQK